MKISFNWLKEYLDFDLTPQKTAEILTDTGLEVEGLEKHESIKGGLEGLVVGEVMSKEQHPNADRLSITQIDIGNNELLNIVCGAPNVDKGQKVVVATVGTTIYPTEGDDFKIKRSKIRGVESLGMLCAEDEIGIGKSHDGIMILDDEAKIGKPLKEILNIENDWLIEIGLTPNRADGMSHIGVARDLLAALKTQDESYKSKSLKWPETSDFKVENTNYNVDIEVKDHEACPRYVGITLSNVKVGPSPEWLQTKLKRIGLSPINNVVDVTNFVLHELGQPLHAFDGDKVKGNKVIVQQLASDTKFKTLDGVERKLHGDDLIICNSDEGMCLAGVFGGIDSGVTESTTKIFLESAYFNPVSVRKTAKRHALNTDASFRFERGIDPEITVYALKRAAILIKELAGAEISSEITDIYPNELKGFDIDFSFEKCNRLIGKDLGKDHVKAIIKALDIQINSENGDILKLHVPAYRVDVKREVDVIEEVLRIYGFNNIDIPQKLNASVNVLPPLDKEKLQSTVSDLLSNNGYSEIMINSITKSKYINLVNSKVVNEDQRVSILNPLSNDLDTLRQSLLFGGLETISYNQNRKNADLKLFEFGKTYKKVESRKYKETRYFSILTSGNLNTENWGTSADKVSFYTIKSTVELVLKRFGLLAGIKKEGIQNDLMDDGLLYTFGNKIVAELGNVKQSLLNDFDIKQDVYYAEINWDVVLQLLGKGKTIKYKEVPKFPAVRRDLSLLIDQPVQFQDIQQIAKKAERKLLQEVDLFDIYQGKNLPAGKKSYAVSFILQDEEKTLKDKQIDKAMASIQQLLESNLGATLR